MKTLDVRGLACPLPVVQVKKEIDGGTLPLKVLTDAGAPLENIRRLAANTKLKVEEKTSEDGYELKLTK